MWWRMGQDIVVEMEDQLQLKVVNSESLSEADRNKIISLCNRAYEEDLEPLFNTFRTATPRSWLLWPILSQSCHVGEPMATGWQ